MVKVSKRGLFGVQELKVWEPRGCGRRVQGFGGLGSSLALDDLLLEVDLSSFRYSYIV